MEISEIKTLARKQVNRKYGILLLACLLYIAAIFVANIIPLIGGVLVCGVLKVGVIDLHMSAMKGHNVRIENMFSYFKDNWGNALYAYLYSIIYIMWYRGLIALVLTLILAYIFSSIAFLFIIIFILVILYLSLEVSMTYYLLVRNEGIDGKEAVLRSAEMMRGENVLKLLKLELSLIGYYLLSFVLFGYGLPYIYGCEITFFDDVYTSK